MPTPQGLHRLAHSGSTIAGRPAQSSVYHVSQGNRLLGLSRPCFLEHGACSKYHGARQYVPNLTCTFFFSFSKTMYGPNCYIHHHFSKAFGRRSKHSTVMLHTMREICYACLHAGTPQSTIHNESVALYTYICHCIHVVRLSLRPETVARVRQSAPLETATPIFIHVSRHYTGQRSCPAPTVPAERSQASKFL